MTINPRFSFLTLFLLWAFVAVAQEASLSGRVVDAESHEGLARTTLQLYKLSTHRNRKDTTYVQGTLSDDQGHFAFRGVGEGEFLVKVSYIGYEDVTRQVKKA